MLPELLFKEAALEQILSNKSQKRLSKSEISPFRYLLFLVSCSNTVFYLPFIP